MTPTPKRRWLRILSLLALAGSPFSSGCVAPIPESATGDGPVPSVNEVVMAPKTSIIAETPQGAITITAGQGLKRSYTWDGATRSVEMWPREKRWYGSLGLYYPGPGNHWTTHQGISRGVVEEGQQHFKTVEDAMKWIADQTWAPLVYRDDGLAVGMRKELSRAQLNVDVWQIYINGRKPDKLPGSQDDKIVVKQLNPGGATLNQSRPTHW